MNQSSDIAQPDVGQIVLVCGMHRSGTSALARVCNLLGGALPQPLVEPAVGNELGHWEPAEVVAMNDRALLSAGGDVNSVYPTDPDWLRSQSAKAFVGDVEAYVRRLRGPQTWFIKDPRISVLAGLWREGVENSGAKPRFIIAFRNPWEVAASLSARQLHHFPDEVWPLERGLALWLKYTLEAEKASRGSPRSFVSYEGFLGDWRGEVRRIYDQAGLEKPSIDAAIEQQIDDFLKPDERHVRHDAMDTRAGLATRVHDMLLQSCADPHGGEADFDGAAHTLSTSFDILGGYAQALEQKCVESRPSTDRASRAEIDVLELKRTLEAKERRIVHLTRRAARHERNDETLHPDELVGDISGKSEEIVLLEKKHSALKAAHLETLDAYKKYRAEAIERFENQDRTLKSKLEEKDRRIAKLEEGSISAQINLDSQRSDLRDSHRSASDESDIAKADIRALQIELQTLQSDLFRTRDELASVRCSNSWRITKPIRAVTTLIRRR